MSVFSFISSPRMMQHLNPVLKDFRIKHFKESLWYSIMVHVWGTPSSFRGFSFLQKMVIILLRNWTENCVIGVPNFQNFWLPNFYLKEYFEHFSTWNTKESNQTRVMMVQSLPLGKPFKEYSFKISIHHFEAQNLTATFHSVLTQKLRM